MKFIVNVYATWILGFATVLIVPTLIIKTTAIFLSLAL